MEGNVYEGMFILDSNRFARDPGSTSGQIDRLIQEAGGEVLVSRLWEERRLAYRIRGHRKGTYWLTYFRIPSSSISPLNRQCLIENAIVRHMILKVNPRIVDALVEHAKTTERTDQAAPTEATPTAGKDSAGKAPAGKDSPPPAEVGAKMEDG